MNITYIPMARGFVYLTAVVDWFSRRALSFRLSISMDVSFCIEALEEALGRYGTRNLQHRPGQPVHQHGLHHGAARQRHRHQHRRQGSWRDNVFVERLWRSIKYEEVYLHAYDTVSDARAAISRYLAFDNGRRPPFER